jgi:1,4-alpha-glucan branching enzyme
MKVTHHLGIMKKKRITFTFHAPEAKSVHIAGSFNDWNAYSDPLSQGKAGRASGMWRRVFYLEPGVYEYRFIVDGVWLDDPDATELWTNEFSSFNCVIWV